MDGIPQAANDRSCHSPEKQRITPKARFRGCGRHSTSSQWQILPQPRKANNCSNSSFSGLWTEFHKQPMTDPTTAPTTSFRSNSLLFGAVARSAKHVLYWLPWLPTEPGPEPGPARTRPEHAHPTRTGPGEPWTGICGQPRNCGHTVDVPCFFWISRKLGEISYFTKWTKTTKLRMTMWSVHW